MLFADMNLSLDPSWPFSLPAFGVPALCVAAGLLVR